MIYGQPVIYLLNEALAGGQREKSYFTPRAKHCANSPDKSGSLTNKLKQTLRFFFGLEEAA